jgi:hypothetical protein
VSSVPWPDESRAHRLKVTLEGIRPPAWRRLEVDGATTLEDLHEVLQIAFGWTDWHLHQFVVDGIAYGAPDPEFVRGSEARGGCGSTTSSAGRGSAWFRSTTSAISGITSSCSKPSLRVRRARGCNGVSAGADCR